VADCVVIASADFDGKLAPYRVQEVLGQGGMGIVLKAFDPTLHRAVAIKILAPQLATSSSARQRFAREARAAAAIRNEHVVAIHSVDEWKELPYLVMEFIPGSSLQARIDRSAPLEVSRTRLIPCPARNREGTGSPDRRT
jgi:eukaryotic-like serine/threonine-protein kinase